MATWKWYGRSGMLLVDKQIDWESDDIKCLLLANTYAPDQDGHTWLSATAWAASTAYNVGDRGRPTTRNGRTYQVTTAGVSAATEPVWPTALNATVTDGTVVWTDMGPNDLLFHEVTGTGYTAGGAAVGGRVVQYDAASNQTRLASGNVSWPSSTITARYAVLYDNTPPLEANKPLMAYLDFGSDQSSSASTLQLVMSSGYPLRLTADV